MKQPEFTQKQQEILKEIYELVVIGQQKLKEFAEESDRIEKKWRQIAEAQRAKVTEKD